MGDERHSGESEGENMSKCTKFCLMSIVLLVLVIGTVGIILNAIWEEDWLKAIFFILCFWLYGGVAKLLVKYGEELIKERKNEK